MAVPKLDELLKRLEARGADELPLDQAASTIELLSHEDLERTRRENATANLVQLGMKWYSAAKTARAAEERQWYKNIDMYQGRQFTEWSDSQHRTVNTIAPDYEPRFCVNIVEPIITTELAKTTSIHPRASVLPASNEDLDIQAALAAEEIWDWFYETSDYHVNTYTTANLWRALFGTGFAKCYFDEGAVDTAATEVARRGFEEMAAQRMMAEGIDLSNLEPPAVRGVIATEAVSPFHLFVGDLTELNFQRQPYIIHAYVMPEERAKALYSRHVKQPDWKPQTVSASELVSLPHLGIQSGGNSTLDHVLVLEVYLKENTHPSFPDGGMFVIAGNELVGVSYDGIPYRHGEYPFAVLTGRETGRFYRKSTIESITPIQDELNKMYNQLIKQRDLMAKPMFYYDEGSLDPRRIRSKPGTYIPVRLGMKYPQPVPIQEVPQYVLQFIDRLGGHLEDISGQHQVSKATSPGADTAASALALLKEVDDDFLSTTFDSIRSFTRTMARHYLSLVVQFWDEPRMVKVAGLDHSIDVKQLTGADIANGTDVTVDGDSVLPKSKAARAAQITEWMDKGYIPPEIGLEAMEMGTLGRVYDKLKRDRDAARYENTLLSKMTVEQIAQAQAEAQAQMSQTMAAGSEIDPMMLEQSMEPQPLLPINWYDNDAIHMEEHRAYANSQAYKGLPPEVQKEYELHYLAHEARAMQMMMQQQAMDPAAQQTEQYADPNAGAEPAIA